MTSVSNIRRYWETVRHLKPVQIYGRLWFRLVRPRVNRRPAPPLRPMGDGAWVAPAHRRPSLVGPTKFRFLNESRDLNAGGWEDAGASKLWLYNLHYFDDLNAVGARDRRGWHEPLVARWIAENPPGMGSGWEPYPVSLRIVNWIKAAWSARALSAAAIHSLAVQTRWLTGRLEYHLLGNHLFANAKALVFAGCFFEGPEADHWLALGLAILGREMDEQVLSDGGHFELSTMYHALAVEDVLDLVNALRASGRKPPEEWEGRLATMRDWLSVMTCTDGEITFFNDAAIGVAPTPANLEAYAVRLGFPARAAPSDRVRHLAESGYVRLEAGSATAWLDVARVGPDYLPGHAHADTLSFELSLAGRRALVNSGTSLYGDGAERLRQRGTGAHNTVTVDRRDSSEVWSGFRVARRACPRDLEMSDDGTIAVSCRHDGYRWVAGTPRHTRCWRFDLRGLVVEDRVDGPHERAEAMFHLHPDFEPAADSDRQWGKAKAPGGAILNWRIARGLGRIEPATWHPEFGLSLPSHRLVVVLDHGESRVEFFWAAA